MNKEPLCYCDGAISAISWVAVRTTALAIAATMKEVNHNVQCEINAARASILARDKGMDFGEVVKMGQRVIGTLSGEEGDQK